MAVSVTGPRAVNELGGPVIPGSILCVFLEIHFFEYIITKKDLLTSAVTVTNIVYRVITT